MSARSYNVLFLCTGNTARSILAESILRKDGAGRFNAFSAGSQPKGEVNPLALKVLAEAGYPTDGMRSKSWAEFAAPGAPAMDFVFAALPLHALDDLTLLAHEPWLGLESVKDTDKSAILLPTFGVDVNRGGKDVNKNLGTILWRHKDAFVNLKGLGYWPADVPLEGLHSPSDPKSS